MKKILLVIMLTLGSIGLIASDSPYIGLGLTATENDDMASCRAGTSLIGGVKFSQADFTFSLEGRHSNSFNGSISDTSVFIKPEYKGAYALVGYGRTDYIEKELEFDGMRYGIGYDFGKDWRHLFVDVIWDEQANDYRLTTGAVYYFETRF